MEKLKQYLTQEIDKLLKLRAPYVGFNQLGWSQSEIEKANYYNGQLDSLANVAWECGFFELHRKCRT